MKSTLFTVGIGTSLLFVVFLGVYVIPEQINSPNMMGMSNFGNNNNSIFIHMGMNMFMPNQLHVKPNTEISWQTHDMKTHDMKTHDMKTHDMKTHDMKTHDMKTHDMKTHNVSGIFKTDSGNEISILSGDIARAETWSYTFEESGVFKYTCGYHENEGMRGEITIV